MKGEVTKVLDHGYVRWIDSMGSDLSVVRSARLSYDADWRSGEDTGSDAKLINYLMVNGHNTPFESVEMQFEIKAPIFVVRQWHRHRTQSFNEVSARYTTLPAEFYIPEQEQVGIQSTHNKQVRDIAPNSNALEATQLMRDQNEDAFRTYQELLALGTPRELARSVLPLSTYTRFYAKANLNNWCKFLKERNHAHAQYEIQVYAKVIESMLSKIAPVSIAAFRGEA